MSDVVCSRPARRPWLACRLVCGAAPRYLAFFLFYSCGRSPPNHTHSYHCSLWITCAIHVGNFDPPLAYPHVHVITCG